MLPSTWLALVMDFIPLKLMLLEGRCALPGNLWCLLCLMRAENSSGTGKPSCTNICLCLFHIHWYVFFSWVAGCGGSVYARDNGIPVVLFPKTKDEPDGLAPNDLVAELRLGFSSQKKEAHLSAILSFYYYYFLSWNFWMLNYFLVDPLVRMFFNFA